MDFSVIGQTLIDSMAVIITALVAWGALELRMYANKRTENEEFKTSLALTITTLENSVKSSIQNLSANAKVAIADGTVSEEELKEIQDKAFKHLNEQVAPELQARLQAHVGDIQTWVVNKIGAELQKAEKVTG